MVRYFEEKRLDMMVRRCKRLGTSQAFFMYKIARQCAVWSGRSANSNL